MEAQDASFEQEIIHNPASIGKGSGDMMMRQFLSTYSSQNPVPWEDDDKEPDYETWRGKLPPFDYIETLGKSQKATVERVRSQKSGLVLARKLVNCEPKQGNESARTEIQCLKGLRHPHIVAMVGAYLDGNTVGILLYPAAEWNLEQFMVNIPDQHGEAQRYHLRRFFVCLAQAVSYLHDLNIRHKDIKPTNILVDSFGNVLFADFGISLRARDKAQLITQSNTNRTYDYCSPEIIAKRKRHPSSDVFSLGAVFAEMATVVLNRTLIDFRNFRQSREGDMSFHRNLGKVQKWMNDITGLLDKQDAMSKAIQTILSMLAYKIDAPKGTDSGIDRPSVNKLWESFQNVSPYICQDCNPRHSSPWKHEPSSEEKDNHLRYFEDLSRESSLQRRERNSTIGNRDPHTDRQAPDQQKTEILLYDPETNTLRMISRADIGGLNLKKEDLPPLRRNLYVNKGDDTYDKIIVRGLGIRVKLKRLFGLIKYIYVLEPPKI